MASRIPCDACAGATPVVVPDLSEALSRRLIATWYSPRPTALAIALWPLSFVFRAVTALRRFLYRCHILPSQQLAVPVVVIGNLTVGGAGKTPLTLALAGALAAQGLHPGIVSRGYAGRNVNPRAVVPGDDPGDVGDEALLHAASGFPVWIGHRRADAARALLQANPRVDVVIADDGLQHYALARTFEIVVVDGARGFGNGWLIPAGPLREPVARATEADAVVTLVAADTSTSSPASAHASTMTLEPLPWRNLADPSVTPAFAALPPGTVHAVAGIGHPERFFALIRAMGIDAIEHAFPDHHRFRAGDVNYPGATAILMTAKDAVKCAALADSRFWCLPVQAHMDPALVRRVLAACKKNVAAT